MKTKQTLKRAVDLIMILLLPVLMAEILTGQEVHEWLGVGMALCFIIHLALNASWFKNLFKGSYSPTRCLQTAVNLFLCADILALLISGIMMSGFVFTWLKVSGGMILARQIHLFASYWGMILMSAHLGLNFGVMLSAVKKLLHIKKDSAVRAWALRILAIGVSAYGIYAVISQKMYQYLFLQTHFVLFDETKSALVFLLETAAMIVLFATVFYALQKSISKIKCGESSTPNDATADANDHFILIKGGSFLMGSPETEGWRSDDETQHMVTVSDFYISPYEVTQKEYETTTGRNNNTV